MLLELEQAYKVLSAHVRPGPMVEVGLPDALMRTLAQPVNCDLDSPPFDRASMDGYAVRASDADAAPVSLTVIGHVDAGVVPSQTLGPGQAMRINTGAPIPQGSDSVVRIEDTTQDTEGRVTIQSCVAPGNFVTPRGDYRRRGDAVLNAGIRLGPAELGVAASAGAARLRVFRRPRVAILSTGSELVESDRVPKGAQIRNSNQIQLAAHVRMAFAEPEILGTSPDEPEILESQIRKGLVSDVLCITGGVSMGTADHVPDVLRRCGVTIRFQKLAIKPGRPIVFGTATSGTLVFALPGNPVSAFVGFELFVRPALAGLEGRGCVRPMTVVARIDGSVPETSNRTTFLPANAAWEDRCRWVARPLRFRGSGDLFGLAGANALIVRAPNSLAACDGDSVELVLLHWS